MAGPGPPTPAPPRAGPAPRPAPPRHGRGLLTTAPPPAPPCMGPFCVESAMAAPAGREAPQLGQGRPRPRPPPPPELPARPPATHRNTARDHAPPPPRPPRIRPNVTSSRPHGLPGNVGPATSRLRPRLVTSEGLLGRRRRAASALAGSASAAARPFPLPARSRPHLCLSARPVGPAQGRLRALAVTAATQ